MARPENRSEARSLSLTLPEETFNYLVWLATLGKLGRARGDVDAQVLRVALDFHLVSRLTSLVAVDVTPTAPAGDVKTAMVKASLPNGWQGTLPQTDTPAALQTL